MGKKWVLVKVYWFSEGPVWLMGNKKLTDEEVDEIRDASTFELDLTPWGFGYKMNSNNIVSEVMMIDGSKENAKKILEKLNNGKDPLSFFDDPYSDDVEE